MSTPATFVSGGPQVDRASRKPVGAKQVVASGGATGTSSLTITGEADGLLITADDLESVTPDVTQPPGTAHFRFGAKTQPTANAVRIPLQTTEIRALTFVVEDASAGATISVIPRALS